MILNIEAPLSEISDTLPSASVPLEQPVQVSTVSYDYFGITFLAMGQGDCVIIRCPNGKVVMVDCGSKAYLDYGLTVNAQQIIRAICKDNANKIDALIFTHHDKDHYNVLKTIVGEFTWINTTTQETLHKFDALEVENVYFSSLSHTGISPLYHYSINGVGSDIYNGTFKTKKLHEVTINKDSSTCRIWERDFSNTTQLIYNPTTENIIGSRKYVFSSEVHEKKKWSISIIAGNVVKENHLEVDKSVTPDNSASLVVLLQYETAKALLCGDSTMSTESFLLSRHGNLIENVELVQVPHHGSKSSSSQPLVNKTNPKVAVISVGQMETSHKLPVYDVVDRWAEKMNKRPAIVTAEHFCDSWYKNPQKAVEVLKSWHDKGYAVFEKQDDQKRVAYYFLDPIREDYAEYVVSASGSLLYRDKFSTPLWLTSNLGQWGRYQNKFLTFTLPLTNY